MTQSDDFKEILKFDFLARIGARIVVDFYQRCDEVWTVVSENAAETLRSYGYHGNIEIISNGTDLSTDPVDAETIKKAKDLINMKPEELTLLFVGRVVWQKNLEMLMESLKIIKNSNTKFRMIFVGAGPAEKPLKSMAKQFGLEDQLSFLGIVDDRSVLKAFFELSDLLVFPSVYDTSGLVVKEAAAANTASLV